MICENIRKVFPDVTVTLDSYFSDKINSWKDIFEGAPPWEKVKQSGLCSRGTRKLGQLNTAKALSDHFSNLTFSEQCEITIDNDAYQAYIDDALNKNGFWRQLPCLLSTAYAFGGCCIKVYADNSEPCINYIVADRFYPIEWTGNSITSGIFESVTQSNGLYYTLYEKHSKNHIERKLFKSSDDTDIGIQCPLAELYPALKDEDTVDTAMFTYFHTAVSNNAEYDVPLGMSVYANAFDTLKALDTAFDSFSREFVLGKKRIIVPAESLQTVVNPQTGAMERYFDADDEAFVALKTEDTNVLKIEDNTAALRIEEHVAGINALLNILCLQTGLSAGALSFDAAEGVKTATEVVSQESKTARTIKSNKNILTESIETVVHALISVGRLIEAIPPVAYTVTVGWQDNVIIDDNTLIDNNVKLVTAGLKSQLSAIMDVLKCDEVTAQKELDRIHKEQAVTGLSVDKLMGGDEDTGEEDSDSEIVEEAEETAGKSLNGAQTQSLIAIITQYQTGTLSLDQAVNIVSAAIGVSKDEARRIIEGSD